MDYIFIIKIGIFIIGLSLIVFAFRKKSIKSRSDYLDEEHKTKEKQFINESLHVFEEPRMKVIISRTDMTKEEYEALGKELISFKQLLSKNRSEVKTKVVEKVEEPILNESEELSEDNLLDIN